MKAKRVLKISLWSLLGLLVVATFVYLFKKSQPKPIEYEVNTVGIVPLIEQKVILSGKIAPRDEIMIVPQLNGIIAEIMHKPGDRVQAGDVIARIKVVPDMGAVNSAESNRQLAKIALEEAEQKYRRDTELHTRGVIADEEFATSQAAYQRAKESYESAVDNYNIVMTGMSKRNAQGSTTLVRSTISGTILDIPVKEGTSVIQANSFNSGTTIATIADLQQMIFVGNVDEIDIAKINLNMPVTICVGALEGVSYPGVIEYISPKMMAQVGSNQSNQYEVKATLTIDDASQIRSDMSASAEVVVKRAENVLAVPEGCLIFEGMDEASQKVYVDVVTEQKGSSLVTERREVVTGISDGAICEIKSGLKEGERVKGVQKSSPSN